MGWCSWLLRSMGTMSWIVWTSLGNTMKWYQCACSLCLVEVVSVCVLTMSRGSGISVRAHYVSWKWYQCACSLCLVEVVSVCVLTMSRAHYVSCSLCLVEVVQVLVLTMSRGSGTHVSAHYVSWKWYTCWCSLCLVLTMSRAHYVSCSLCLVEVVSVLVLTMSHGSGTSVGAHYVSWKWYKCWCSLCLMEVVQVLVLTMSRGSIYKLL